MRNIFSLTLLLFLILPVGAFGSKPQSRIRIEPSFETKILRIGKKANAPKISMALPSDWVAQNEVDNESAYDIQFYPLGQNINWATDLIRLQVLKFHVANDKDALFEAAQAIKKQMLAENNNIEFLDTQEYKQTGLNTVEILSLVKGAGKQRTLKLTKLIATDDLARNTYGFISLNKLSLQINGDKDLEQALLDIEVYREQFRRLKLLDWSKWDFDQDLEHKTIELKNGAAIELEIPRGWISSELKETDEAYSWTIKDPELDQRIELAVSKGPLLNGYSALEGYVYELTQEAVKKVQPGTSFSPPVRYEQNGLKTTEYVSEWSAPDGSKLLSLYKDIDTGFNTSNNLGLVSIRKIVSVNTGVLQAKEKLASYKEVFRNIKLVNWSSANELAEASFEQRQIELGSEGAKLLLNLPSDWNLTKQNESSSAYNFTFNPEQEAALLSESVKLSVYKTESLYSLESLYAYLDLQRKSEGPNAQFSQVTEYLSEEGLQMIEYDSINTVNGLKLYSTHKLISTGLEADNDLALILLSKQSVALGNYAEDQISTNLGLFKTELRELAIRDWAKAKPVDSDSYENKIINIGSEAKPAQISIPMPSNWQQADSFESDKYITLSFKPAKPLFGKNDLLRVSILKMPYIDSYENLHQFSQTLKSSMLVKHPEASISDDIEYKQSRQKTVEFNANWVSGSNITVLGLNKVIGTGFAFSNYLGLVHLTRQSSFHTIFDINKVAGDIEGYRKKLRAVKFIDWQANKSRPVLNFKNKIVNVLKGRGGAKLALPIPDTWDLVSREEDDKSIKFTFLPNNKDALIGESILLIVRKGYFKNEADAINEVMQDLKAKLIEKYARVQFSNDYQYFQEGNNMLEYTSSYQTDKGAKVVLLDKLITTGSQASNKLGLLIVSKVYTSVKEVDMSKLEPEMDLYRQQFRKLKLLKWEL